MTEPAIDIIEAYRNWSPSVHANRIVSRLVASVEPRYLVGLDRIVLTNAGGMSHSLRRKKTWSRKKKISIAESAGLYHQAWRGQPAWIEIFVDNILDQQPISFMKIPPIRDRVFSSVIFHEIGHHIHKTIAPEHREREDAANFWARRLSRPYFRRRYWYLYPALVLTSWIGKILGIKATA